jgi:hypothetical protein
MTQPNFSTNLNAIPSTEYDKLSPEDLDKLINAAHQVRTGRTGRVSSAPPVAPKRVVDLESILGGLSG